MELDRRLQNTDPETRVQTNEEINGNYDKVWNAGPENLQIGSSTAGSRNNGFLDIGNNFQMKIENSDRKSEAASSMSENKQMNSTSDNKISSKFGCFKRSNVRLFFYFMFVSFYLCIGAVLFQALEGPVEETMGSLMMNLRYEFLINHTSCLEGT